MKKAVATANRLRAPNKTTTLVAHLTLDVIFSSFIVRGMDCLLLLMDWPASTVGGN